MGKFWKVARYVLLGFVAVCGVLIALVAIMSDHLTKAQALQRIMAADEPCRAAYAKALDLQGARGPELIEAARTGEPLCRASFKQLDDINIFISSKAGSDSREKQTAIDACAALSRARAERLAFIAAEPADPQRMQALDAELERTDRLCQTSFARLAR